MALRKKLTVEEFNKLTATMKKEYKKNDDDDGYELDLEDDDGGEDVGALKRAKDRETKAARDLRKQLKEANDKVAELEGKTTEKETDVEKIKLAAQRRYDTDVTAANEKAAKLQKRMSDAAIDAAARTLATKISKAPTLLLPHIKSQLTVEFDDEDTPFVRVIGDDGKPNGKDMSWLEKQVAGNKEFADIIIASKASGAGGAGRQDPPKNAGGAGSTTTTTPGTTEQKPDLSRVPAKDLAGMLKARKEASEAA